jgi:DAK2 domain fusion protein YloV
MTSQTKSRLDGNELREMLSATTRLFERNVDAINALNVFPVPDGDTGINMYLTLTDVVKQAGETQGAMAGEVAGAMAKGALHGARGNSGVILSQIFKGIAQGLEGKADFGCADIASALQNARESAYRAVGEPVEGTILTVISSAASAARDCADANASLRDMFEGVSSAAKEAVALTPTMMPLLRDAGVVDAGGQGLSVIFEGFRLYLNGGDVDTAEITTLAPTKGAISLEFLDFADEEQYGYCTQFLIEGENLDPEAVREAMNSIARSTVVVGDDKAVKTHVHTEDPGAVLSYAVSLGTLGQVKIQNMDEQRREFSAARRQESESQPQEKVNLPIAVVAVAWGSGLEKVFTELGASTILRCGDTMNPSIQEILDIVDSAPSDNVIFLPNNKNIVPAARQAVELSAKNLGVLPTTTLPQGISALLAFSPEKDLGDNLDEMKESYSEVRTAEISEAVRPVELNGVSVREGQVIGLLERELKVAGEDSTQVLVALLEKAGVSEDKLVTLYWGQRLTKEDAEEALANVESAFPGTEVEVVPGGQPHYHYIISIE